MSSTSPTILVPPARPERNPLRDMLQRAGLAVLEFPALVDGPPPDPAALREAVARSRDMRWLVVAGARSAEHLQVLLPDTGLRPEQLPPIAAIGSGAFAVLRRAGLQPRLHAEVHTAPEVADLLGALDGAEVLLVRSDRASRSLPRELTRRGARVHEAIGYSLGIHTEVPAREPVRAGRFDLVALGNPTAVELLGAALRSLDRDWSLLEGKRVAAVGPATAAALAATGRSADLIAGGRLVHLVEALTAQLGAGATA